MGAAEPVISVSGLTARYGGEGILEGVSFQVPKGERFVILGESGCGKSTLLKNIIGLFRPSSGRVLVKGTDIASAGEEEMKRLRLHIGMLFQSGALFGSMTLYENIALPLSQHVKLEEAFVGELVRMKLAMVNLAGYENHLPGELSGGMQKRAGIARAIAHDPEILFLDEPSAGLDPVTAAELDHLMKSINEGMGTTLVIVTQELASVFEVCTRCIMLDKGEKGIIAEGDPRDLRDNSREERVLNFFNRRPPAAGGPGR
jgi:phospholipid/cholesterol/gamma-HCH transport system ATP-binding protein